MQAQVTGVRFEDDSCSIPVPSKRAVWGILNLACMYPKCIQTDGFSLGSSGMVAFQGLWNRLSLLAFVGVLGVALGDLIGWLATLVFEVSGLFLSLSGLSVELPPWLAGAGNIKYVTVMSPSSLSI